MNKINTHISIVYLRDKKERSKVSAFDTALLMPRVLKLILICRINFKYGKENETQKFKKIFTPSFYGDFMSIKINSNFRINFKYESQNRETEAKTSLS